MSSSTQKEPLPLLRGWNLDLAAGVLFILSLLTCIGAFWASWSPGLSGQGNVHDALVAIALIAAALAFGVLSLGFFLLDILVRIKKVESQVPPTADDLKPRT